MSIRDFMDDFSRKDITWDINGKLELLDAMVRGEDVDPEFSELHEREEMYR